MNPTVSTSSSPSDTIAYLRSPLAIRERCQQIFELACHDQLDHFACNLDRLGIVADYVIQVMKHHYPDLEIPFHSRWRHFEVGTPDRMDALNQLLRQFDPARQARIKIDLTVVSVLLDAGAGDTWRYTEPQTGLTFTRSEGLAIASFHLFCDGAFSSDDHHPLRVDAEGLRTFSLDDLKRGFQVTEDNPLVGLEGRLHLLHKLGDALLQSPHLFGPEVPRPGHWVDYLMQSYLAQPIPASAVLLAVLEGLGDIWPGRVEIDGINLGDVWPHPALPDTSLGSNLIPFHKLSQWLTYSLLEPLTDAGLTVTELDSLTGLPEYRNGGLFIDLGVLQPKHSAILQAAHSPGSTVIVEWRALTVMLLDRLADRIRQSLGMDATQLPLARILQGGTWTAGRRIAGDRRHGGTPPLQICSDGTVF